VENWDPGRKRKREDKRGKERGVKKKASAAPPLRTGQLPGDTCPKKVKVKGNCETG